MERHPLEKMGVLCVGRHSPLSPTETSSLKGVSGDDNEGQCLVVMEKERGTWPTGFISTTSKVLHQHGTLVNNVDAESFGT